MSSAPSGRYKSKLFNFLSRNFRRVNDKSNQFVRQAQVATVWGAQIILYPVYLLAQSVRFAGHKLRAAAKRGTSPLQPQRAEPKTPPAVDTAIQQVLVAVNNALEPEPVENPRLAANLLELPVAKTESVNFWTAAVNSFSRALWGFKLFQKAYTQVANAPLALSSKNDGRVRAIACLLSSRNLVLVTAQNQILDILTPDQQQKLSKRISWELAEFGRRQKRSQPLQRQFTGVVREFDDKRLVVPLRFFWVMMAWVQNSPVAIAANVFQESNLIQIQAPEFKLENSALIREQLALLDSKVAQIEAISFVPPEKLRNALGDSTRSWLEKIKVRFGTQTPQTISLNLPTQTDASKAENLRVYVLVQSAIDYFFGKSSDDLVGNVSVEQLAIAADAKEEINQIEGGVIASLHSGAGVSEQQQKRGLLPRSRLTKAMRDRATALFQTTQARFEKPVVQDTSPNLATVADAHINDNFRIRVLIRSAIDYFFVRVSVYLDGANSSEQAAIAQSQQAQVNQLRGNLSVPTTKQSSSSLANIEPDPWLTINDLFGDAPAARSASKEADVSRSLPANKDRLSENEIKPRALQNRNSQQPKKQENSKRDRQSAGRGKGSIPTRLGKLASQQSSQQMQDAPSTINNAASDPHGDEKPDFIETKATPMGYVKHPLEVLLEWLDRGMLLIEQAIVKVWRWLRNFF